MRKYAILKKPMKVNNHDAIYKIMFFQDKQDVYLFEYCNKDAIFSSYDNWYPDIESVYEDWDEFIDEYGWIDIEDPLPDCQHDAFLPIRVKGRSSNEPQWGCYEVLKNGEWTDYEE